ncbi:hypothetical protein HN51_059854 [Arachis hypogaea]
MPDLLYCRSLSSVLNCSCLAVPLPVSAQGLEPYVSSSCNVPSSSTITASNALFARENHLNLPFILALAARLPCFLPSVNARILRGCYYSSFMGVAACIAQFICLYYSILSL